MYCLRYWARYVRKEEVKSGGIKKFTIQVTAIHNTHKEKNREIFGKGGCSIFLVELWASTLCAEVVLAIQHLLGCCIQGETSQRRSTPVMKFSQPRA